MGRFRVLSGKEVCAIPAKHGFMEARRRGSHIVMQQQRPEGTTTIPVPNHHEIRIGTLKSIIRQSGLPGTEFES